MSTQVIPMIHVQDVRATVAWYVSIGFTLQSTDEDDGRMTWACLAYGDSEVMFNAGGRPSDAPRRDVDLYARVPNVEALYTRLRGAVPVIEHLHDTFHGHREFIIRDPNGFWITFGQVIASDGAAAAVLRAVQPVLMVRDVSRSIQFYAGLGFELVFGDDPERPLYAGVRRDGAELHLQWHDASAWQQPGDRPTYRFLVDDPDRLSAELDTRGASLDRKPVSDTAWGTREFHVRDPDGNGLQFYRDL